MLGAIANYFYELAAAEISTVTRYLSLVVQLDPLPDDRSRLLRSIVCPLKEVSAIDSLSIPPEGHTIGAVLLNGNLNHELDIQNTLNQVSEKIPPQWRVIVLTYNPHYRALYWVANKLRIRRGVLPSTFTRVDDLRVIARLSSLEVVRVRAVGFFPFRLFGLGTLINRTLTAIPLLWRFGVAWMVILRPVKARDAVPLLSIVVPARNERENIEPLLTRVARAYRHPYEIVLVEGHSTDGTWERVNDLLSQEEFGRVARALKQQGRGKADAVRLGFESAKGDLLVILDADLTMPPEYLERFVEVWRSGLADFVHGNRLVYPIEGRGMKPLNWLGNHFFARALSFVLQTRIGDSLCGTKLLHRSDYERFLKWRERFGEFDPFGDFELLFPAAQLGLSIIDIPLHYRDRVYGTTNILRFRHGLMLLRMTILGLLRIRMGQPISETSGP